MKKFLVLFMCLLLLGLVACQKAGAKALKKEDLDSQKKKVSYAIGLDIGKNFKTRSMDIDIAILFEGLKDSQKTGEPLLGSRGDPEGHDPVPAGHDEGRAGEAPGARARTTRPRKRPSSRRTPPSRA